ncbi:MAG: PTS sugar transporter subunit IIA [Candidatus Lambdaproteobacteria bacterium]|nr:PTS sugar transporter subunit IIA [Candidatus Lambdaproteobacteria bacterium]
MQLTVPEAAQLLQVPEETVYRWIRDRGLPASSFGGRYHLNRVWLLEWAHDKGIPIAMDADDRMPGLAEALARGGLHVDIPGRSKPEVLQATVDRLPLPAEVDRAYLRQMLLVRERQGSTGFGGGIAIPHSRGPILLHVPEPLVAICHLREAVDFGALDGQPVSTLFVQVTPTVRIHLHLLARIAKALFEPSFTRLVRSRTDLPQVLEQLRRMESQSRTPAGQPSAPAAT